MFRNSHNLRGSSTHAGNLVPRWRMVFIALMLALAFGSVGQTPPAQAAPVVRHDIDFELAVYPEKTPTICVNKEFRLYAGVSKTIYKGIIGLDGKEIPIPGRVTAPEVSGVKVSGVGTLEKVGGGELAALEGENVFTFKSDKAGTATLKFTVMIQDSWIGANEDVLKSPVMREKEVTLKVGCKVKVNTISTFKAGMTSVGTMDGEMKADEQGNFTGSATVNWVTSMLCGISSPIDPSQADLTGTFNESGQLTGQVTFGPMSSSGGGNCLIASVTTSNFGTIDPLTIKASSDGVSVYTQAQTVTATNGSFPGTATIVVIPEEDGAAAFNPGDHEARVGPLFPGWAVQWDDFSSLLGALLALP